MIKIIAMKDSFILNVRGKTIELGRRTAVMGILNVTPDSFSNGGRYWEHNKAFERGIQMIEEGADIIDIGGESTRPGSNTVSIQEEIDRIMPIVENIVKKVIVSVDTYKADVAEIALKSGVHIINDISAMRFDSRMVEVVRKYNVPIILMHIKGTPKDMQKDPEYDDLLEEIKEYFEERIDFAIYNGIKLENIIIDPGIGFGKQIKDNFLLLKRLSDLKIFGCPILIGPSRKSFIGSILNLPSDERIEGTAAAVTAGILNGANIVRVHDVKEMVRVVKIADEILYSDINIM